MILQITPVDLMGILLAIFIIVPFVILTFIAIWVYKDAKKKGINTVVWVLTVWIIPFFIGFIIYLIARNKIIENPT
ncbi:hypothetical protein LCGC14_1229570 [marine sediment metagenome]|uniref:Cardiolipin synthase N-terminal domain-containing protein n=1 Tax=marine sediment metagenome TaxID=412755 RepID=A0A0F9LW32_9ZZZZ